MSGVTGDKELILYIGTIEHSIAENITREISLIMAELKEYVKNEKLQGQALFERTGNLRNSVSDSISSARDIVEGTLSATGVSDKGFPYGYVHEYNLGHYKDSKDHSYMRSSLKENEETIMARINIAIERALYGKA